MVIAIDLGNMASRSPTIHKFLPGGLCKGQGRNQRKLMTCAYYGFLVEEPFKHLIVVDKDLPDDIRRSPHLAKVKQIMRKLGKKPFEIVGDYLRKLWSHSWNYICQSEGLEHQSAFNVVLCILSPVTWPSDTRVEITNALRHAGFLHDITRERFALRFFPDFSTAVFAWYRGCRPYSVISRIPFMATEHTKAQGKLPLHLSHIRTNIITAAKKCGTSFMPST
ncbi:heat shock 70 kDa 12B [Fusarium subglutinans]|uniref:Heat shock 70 kDa 12B n=1 Tax=Gibberella subglutinans TaxID=42677 RepID=A0A8H5Q955_GIBSU|nr:heat shock 70 kDa 12B [Fusarium subglutinans]KAF5610378.1 heat shock 70 kDa 12B [Fusarium subglutinans]